MSKVALVTGGAKRIGKGIAKALHENGYSVLIHYHTSKGEAEEFVGELNSIRANSAKCYSTSFQTYSEDGLTLPERCQDLMRHCVNAFGSCDVLVNNASAYYPTPLTEDRSTEVKFEADLFGSNAVAPFYLIQALVQHNQNRDSNKERNVSVVNMVDAMTNQPLLGFTLYTMAKHALEGLTKSAALELAPLHIRVNGVGPGLSALPVSMSEEEQDVYRSKVPLYQREASPEDIANAVAFVVSDKANYITGSIINVDGGWSLTRQ